MNTRRDFLRSLPLISLAPTVPGFIARATRGSAPERDSRVLVVIQLDGGNDGLNTVIPFGDDAYAQNRPNLKLAADRILKVSDGIGLHPAMSGASKLLESGRLGIVPGVGYPNPNRSHFASMAIWQSARLDAETNPGSTGWLGRGLDSIDDGSSLLVGSGEIPLALKGRKSLASSLDRIEDLTLDPSFSRSEIRKDGDDLAAFVRRSTLDAYTSSDRLAELSKDTSASARYPATALANRLKLISRLLKGGFASRVFYTSQSGYDTHQAQANTHYSLLDEFSDAIQAFLDDLAASRLDDRVVVVAFSEFGRRVLENGSNGTDHGAAGPVFLAGPSVKAGLLGAYPSLTDLVDGDLKPSVDFRQIYATLLENWLKVPSETALGGKFALLPLLRV